MSKVNILGVEIDSLDEEEISEKLASLLHNGRPHLITTPNPEIILAAGHDPEFKKILNNSDLALPDGFGLMLASCYLKKRLKRRMAGIDLMLKICRLAAEKNHSVFLLGGQGRVPEKTAEKLLAKFPNLKIAGFENGFRSWGWRLPEGKLREKIKRAKPDIIFVAFGAPRQEKWLYNNLPKLTSVKIGMGVGGAFDYISGQVRRAPAIMRQLGLEWLFRLWRQPWRWPRIINATFRFSLEILKIKKNK
ncbi:MAG: WecB/TagA/CpsF family glycosyltransferase [Patescibacteria group bacterium]